MPTIIYIKMTCASDAVNEVPQYESKRQALNCPGDNLIHSFRKCYILHCKLGQKNYLTKPSSCFFFSTVMNL